MTGAEDRRPPAQYGEYATAEEQQKAKGLPEPVADAAPADAAQPTPHAAAHESRPHADPARSGPAHPVDRIVTLVLLGLGLFVWLNGIPGYLALADALQAVFDQLGAGTYQAAETAAALGVTALVIQGILWAVTAASAWIVLKRAKLAWWVPVVGAAVSFIASMVIVSIALFADPGFIDAVSAQTLP
jgi:hypothetical protein